MREWHAKGDTSIKSEACTWNIVSWPASKLSYLGERSEPRENARASGEGARSRRVSSRVPLARVLFTISPNGELALRLTVNYLSSPSY